MNAKHELLEVLEHYGKNKQDIKNLAIKVHFYSAKQPKVVSIDTFNDIDKIDIEYDDGYGSQNLFGYVLFKDGTWFERWEYDGSEGWDYKKVPTVEYLNKLVEGWRGNL